MLQKYQAFKLDLSLNWTPYLQLLRWGTSLNKPFAVDRRAFPWSSVWRGQNWPPHQGAARRSVLIQAPSRPWRAYLQDFSITICKRRCIFRNQNCFLYNNLPVLASVDEHSLWGLLLLMGFQKCEVMEMLVGPHYCQAAWSVCQCIWMLLWFSLTAWSCKETLSPLITWSPVSTRSISKGNPFPNC